MLSDSELTALELLKRAGEHRLISDIPERNERGVFGVEPGISVYKRLEKKGLVVFTEEEPMSDGFMFTPMVYLTDAGRKALEVS